MQFIVCSTDAGAQDLGYICQHLMTVGKFMVLLLAVIIIIAAISDTDVRWLPGYPSSDSISYSA